MARLVRSAKVIVLDASGRALLLRRSGTHPKFALAPDLPGGEIAPDETYEAGGLRELFEETGIMPAQINKVQPLYKGVFYQPDVEMARMLLGVRLRVEQPSIKLSVEHDRFEWVDVTELTGIEEPYQGGIRYVHLYDLWRTIK